MNPWVQLLGSGGLAAIAVVFVNVLAQRRNLGAQTLRTDAETHRTDAETDEVIRSTYKGMLDDVSARLDAALARINEMESKNLDLRNTVALLVSDRDDLLRWVNGALLPWVENGATPPGPAVPDHLADFLPQWIPVRRRDLRGDDS